MYVRGVITEQLRFESCLRDQRPFGDHYAPVMGHESKASCPSICTTSSVDSCKMAQGAPYQLVVGFPQPARSRAQRYYQSAGAVVIYLRSGYRTQDHLIPRPKSHS